MKNSGMMYGGGGSPEGPRMPNIPEGLRGKSAKKEKTGVTGLDALEKLKISRSSTKEKTGVTGLDALGKLKLDDRASKKEPRTGLAAARIVTGGETRKEEKRPEEVAAAGLEAFKKYQEKRGEGGGVQGALDEARGALSEQEIIEQHEEAMEAPGEVIEVTPENIDDVTAELEKEKELSSREFFDKVMDKIMEIAYPKIAGSDFLKRVPSSNEYRTITEDDVRSKLNIACQNYLRENFPQQFRKGDKFGSAGDKPPEVLDMGHEWRKTMPLTESNANRLGNQLARQFVEKFLEMMENSKSGEYIKAKKVENEKEVA